MNKKTIVFILLLLSGCQKLSTSVPGRVDSSTSVHYVSTHAHGSSMTSSFSSSNSSSFFINTSSNSSSSFSSSNSSSSSNDNHHFHENEINLNLYFETYGLDKNIEIVEELSNEQLELKIQELKTYHQNIEIYRFNENFKRNDSKLISIESNVDRKEEKVELIVSIESADGTIKHEEAYVVDNKYYDCVHNVGEEEYVESNDLSTIGDYEFVLSNLNAYYSNSMINPFKDVDSANMQYGYDANGNIIIQNDQYRLVVSEEEYIYKVTNDEYFVIEYNVANFNFPDFIK